MFIRALRAKDGFTNDDKFAICEQYLRNHFVNDRTFQSYRRGIYKLFLKEIGFDGIPLEDHPYYVSTEVLYSEKTLEKGYTIR